MYSDDFNGAAGSAPNPKMWYPLQGAGGWGNGELESYTNRPTNVALDGAGDLRITAHRETYTGPDHITAQYTSARLVSIGSIKYGYVEARIKTPAGKGLWPAFWTIGANVLTGTPWPVTGEIDVMEAMNSVPWVTGGIHGPTTSGSAFATQVVSPLTTVVNTWHTYAVNWTSTAITWYLDGVAYGTLTRASLPSTDVWELDTPQMVQLNLAVGGSTPGAPDETTPFPASMLVDYVRVYSN